MSEDIVSPWEVYWLVLSQEERNLLTKIIDFINSKLRAIKPETLKAIDVNCGEFAQAVAELSDGRRELLLELLRSCFLGTNPPWAEVWYVGYFPHKGSEKKAVLAVSFSLKPGRYHSSYRKLDT
jgi:hypothetical protein